jgi:mycothiol synthase
MEIGRKMLEPRLYQSQSDLAQMMEILAVGKKAANGTFYIHTGDLSWWLYYTLPADDLWPNLYAWDDPHTFGRLLGWTLFSPKWSAFDVFIRPELRGSPQQGEIFAWSVNHLAERVKAQGGSKIRTMWIADDDDLTIRLLEKLGFSAGDGFMLSMERSLQQPIVCPDLPDGFQVCNVSGEADLQRRAMAQISAFESSWPFDQYCQRYQRFMHSPVYAAEKDLGIIAPDGRFAAFCIIWLDAMNRVGLFEPVGTHQDFQRRGLGKAVIYEGLRRMQAQGMQTAIVNVESDNPAAEKLYRSCGFQPARRIVTYSRSL